MGEGKYDALGMNCIKFDVPDKTTVESIKKFLSI